MKGGQDVNDLELVKVLANNSSGSIEWLISLGADMSNVDRIGGASVNRSHRPAGGAGVGAHVAQVLWDNAARCAVTPGPGKGCGWKYHQGTVCRR